MNETPMPTWESALDFYVRSSWLGSFCWAGWMRDAATWYFVKRFKRKWAFYCQIREDAERLLKIAEQVRNSKMV